MHHNYYLLYIILTITYRVLLTVMEYFIQKNERLLYNIFIIFTLMKGRRHTICLCACFYAEHTLKLMT